MKSRNDCPTCGTTLGPLHADAVVECGACQRPNPKGFRYCGFCATPMESEAQRAEIADVAAPPGGWPNLSRELVELRFYMDRGELDEAFELLTILRDRHPGHPALTEFKRSSEGERPRPDTQVNRVVDSVLAGSQSLNSAMPRRSVPQWKGPKAGAPAEGPAAGSSTRAHATVPLGSGERRGKSKTKGKTKTKAKTKRKSQTKSPSPVRKRVVQLDGRGQPLPIPRDQGVPQPKTARPTTAKHLGAVPVSSAKASRSKGSSNPDAITKPEPVAPTAGSFEAPPEEPIRPGLTVAVPTLQAPAPYQDEKSAKNIVRKRSMKSRKRTGRQDQAKAGTDESTPRRRRRGDGFGQHVLGRMGRKKK